MFIKFESVFVVRQAGKTLSERRWRAAFSPEGYLDIGRTLSRIHRGVIAFPIIKYYFDMFQDINFALSVILHLHVN